MYYTYIIIGFIIIIILAWVIIITRQNQNKIRQQQKEAEMSQTLIRTQMNPHFIFNSLNSIQSFVISNNTDKAIHYLAKTYLDKEEVRKGFSILLSVH